MNPLDEALLVVKNLVVCDCWDYVEGHVFYTSHGSEVLADAIRLLVKHGRLELVNSLDKSWVLAKEVACGQSR
jgi:hypothetical protein